MSSCASEVLKLDFLRGDFVLGDAIDLSSFSCIQSNNQTLVMEKLDQFTSFSSPASSELATVDIRLGLGLIVSSLAFGHETVFKLESLR